MSETLFPPTPEVPKRRTLEQVFEATASKFGTTAERLIASAGRRRDAAQTAATVASFLAFMEGYNNPTIARYMSRSVSAVSWTHTRIRERPEQLRLAWGIWHSWGGSWEKFASFSYAPEQYDLPSDTEYLRYMISRPKADPPPDDPGAPSMLNSSVALSSNAIRYLGLDEAYHDERGVSQAILKQAIEDLFIGCDATRWIRDEREHVEGAVTWNEACSQCGLDPDWLRKQVLTAARRVAEGKDGTDWMDGK